MKRKGLYVNVLSWSCLVWGLILLLALGYIGWNIYKIITSDTGIGIYIVRLSIPFACVLTFAYHYEFAYKHLHLDCDNGNTVNTVFDNVACIAFLYLVSFFQDIFSDNIPNKAVLILSYIFPVIMNIWSYFSVIYFKKNAIFLIRASLMSSILWCVFLLVIVFISIIRLLIVTLNTNFEMPFQMLGSKIFNVIYFVIFSLYIVTVSVRTLILTFSEDWRKQFTNQNYSFFIIFVIVLMMVLSIASLYVLVSLLEVTNVPP